MMRDVLRALRHMHQRHMVHCDIKPANVLFTRQQGGGYRFKICDMGLALRLAPRGCDLPHFTGHYGTQGCVAPEVVQAGIGQGRWSGVGIDEYAAMLLLIKALTGLDATKWFGEVVVNKKVEIDQDAVDGYDFTTLQVGGGLGDPGDVRWMYCVPHGSSAYIDM